MKYAEQLREAVATTFLTLEAQFVLTGQLSGQSILLSGLTTCSQHNKVDTSAWRHSSCNNRTVAANIATTHIVRLEDVFLCNVHLWQGF